MKAVMASVPEHILEWRRRTGADQWDEMWEGVLHMRRAQIATIRVLSFSCNRGCMNTGRSAVAVKFIINGMLRSRAHGLTITVFPTWCC